MSTRRMVVALTAVMAVTVGACGVPTGPDSFELLEEDVVPDRLSSPATTTTTSTTTTTTTLPNQPNTTLPATTVPPVLTEDVPVFFLSRGRLTSIQVAAPLAPQPNDLVLLLQAGPEGPLAGLLENLIDEDLIVSTSQVEGVLTIELDEVLFRRISSRDQLEAIGQMVLTFLSSLSGVGQAAFTIDGEPLTVPTGARDFTDEPVSFDDYENLLVDVGDDFVPTFPDAGGTTTTTTDPDAADTGDPDG